MRTTIDIDESLFHRVRSILGGETKREVVRRALEEVIRVENQRAVLALRGSRPDVFAPPRSRETDRS
jgi:Arc/MetJ family transcription regulator